MRIGYGVDIHQLVQGKEIKLCGVTIPSNYTIKAHSDGDIIFHACADAIYGAIAKGDIGEHFPDTNSSNKNIDSSKILLDASNQMTALNYVIQNIDITLILEEPKINKFKEKMIANLSSILKIHLDQVNIKATTNEKLGYVGENKGIKCYSIILIETNDT
ncbi:MAG: 2-C-methyl-D-erythritol 2,4-cyclodiphosphate synthase [Gammaproteobacteria bacterium]|nr:2-C-methyl-D-erythritol 2,4-cyclodiphosphate synthase [Gammaproteobacteria bacterium]|tara:strand:- start:26428 stop:26907 length:480 start_codon:yes stop_codon:yes gene_type:complete